MEEEITALREKCKEQEAELVRLRARVGELESKSNPVATTHLVDAALAHREFYGEEINSV